MIQTLVALDVLDEDGYRKYRAGMTPILHAHGGRFVVDVKTSETLLLPQPGPVNRLFSIEFTSIERLESFFLNPEYLAVRKEHFESSVGNIVSLGRFEVL